MNNDLISREALLKVLCEGCNGAKKKGCGNPCCDYELIELAPAVDAEPVVRCKDCAEYIPWGDDRICGRIGSYFGNTKPNDYCSRGRKNDE